MDGFGAGRGGDGRGPGGGELGGRVAGGAQVGGEQRGGFGFEVRKLGVRVELLVDGGEILLGGERGG